MKHIRSNRDSQITMKCPYCDYKRYDIYAEFDPCAEALVGTCTCDRCGTQWEFDMSPLITDDNIDNDTINIPDDVDERLENYKINSIWY